MKFSKFAAVGSLALLAGSPLAFAQDAPQETPDVDEVLASLPSPQELGDQLGDQQCGWGSDTSCSIYADDPESTIVMGVWLCPSDDLENDCACTDYKGCDNANYYGEYWMNPNDQGDNTLCDTLGGWRSDDYESAGLYIWSNWGEDFPVFGGDEYGVHVEVHPADWYKLGGDPSMAQVFVHSGDYCTGNTPEGYAYPAYGGAGDNDWGYAFPVKSLRPYIDFNTMWDFAPEDGVGVKMNVWPQRNMNHPYDQMLCTTDDPDAPGLWDIGDSNLPDGDCQKTEDNVWCMINTDDDGNPGQWSWGGYWGGQHDPYVPMGSVLFGLEDSIPCTDTRSDYCSWVDQENVCLIGRFYDYGWCDEDYIEDNGLDIPCDPSSVPDDWGWDTADFVGEFQIQMSELCNNDMVCLNTSDGSDDDDGTGIRPCQDFRITNMDGDPWYDPENPSAEQMWWSNYIIKVGPCQ